jgi:type II secretory pathway pseudopilin PulG
MRRGLKQIPGRPLGSQSRSRILNEKGWTLVELMLVTALIAIITPAITTLFAKVSQGMAADEMHLQLQSLNEQTMLRLHERLITGRHLFHADSSGVSYLGCVTRGMSANTLSTYPVLSGSQLAIVQPATGTGSFSPTLAVAADFGNSLLVGGYDTPQTFGTLIYNAPATAFYNTTANNYVTYGAANGSGPATQVIDLYRFTYYYLTSHNDKTPRGVTSYGLVEWQSVQYADANELGNIADSTLEGNVITWLSTPGNVSPNDPTYAITGAWDPTQADPNSYALESAFYTLSGGNLNPAAWPVAIQEGHVTYLTHVSSGLLSNGFFYGVSPNSSLWSGVPATVPEYAAASGSFPGGFEVGISGNAAGVQVMLRSLLVAQGASPKVVWNDQTMVDNVRDVW